MRTIRTSQVVMMTGLLVLAAGMAVAQDEAPQPALVLDGPLMFADGSMMATAMAAGYSGVHDTGFQGCWDQDGISIACSGTGQDGELQAGVDWPLPRFTANGDGTVLDNLTGLIWLQEANCFGLKRWDAAVADANSLMNGMCGLSDGSLAMDWRLPNVKELLSLIHYGAWEPALPAGHPFLNVQNAWYWSSTSGAEDPANAWGVGIDSGNTDNGDKYYTQFVWAVRGGS